jgi:hypothetical protein
MDDLQVTAQAKHSTSSTKREEAPEVDEGAANGVLDMMAAAGARVDEELRTDERLAWDKLGIKPKRRRKNARTSR